MSWPELTAEKDGSTFAKLHLVSQMIGKVKVANSHWVNHGWHIALQPVADGLQLLPIHADGRRFTLGLDLCRHAITLQTNNGTQDAVEIEQGSIAAIHKGLVGMLERHGLPATFHGTPNEVEEAIPFAKDERIMAYSPDSAQDLREALVAMLPTFEQFRAGFVGKSSPVHFFWGSFDLALTRFSGREAPPHPGGLPNFPDRIAQEAYSHEVASVGFWAGGVVPADPIFYAYAYPEPDGYRDGSSVKHGAWSDEMQEYVLPYAAVRESDDPAAMLLEFMDTSYRLAADKADWPDGLIREPVAP